MANPQLENGYLKISNEIIEALAKIRISGEARQMLDVIIRKTYGYDKKSDMISTSQFCQATGLNKLAITRARKKLLVSKMITVIKNDTSQILSYSIQKDYDKWVVVSKMITGIKNDTRGYQKQSQRGIKNEPHNIQYNKHITKYNSDILFEIFYKEYPKKVGKENARKAFKKLDFNETLLNTMILAIKAQRGSEQWIKNDGEFIPHPATWLNGKRWLDEVKKERRLDPYVGLPKQNF